MITLALVRTNGTQGVVLYLFDPLGNQILSAGGTGAPVVHDPRVPLTETGSYTLVVVAVGLNGVYDYTICALKIPGPNITDPGEGPYRLSPAETRSAHLSPGDLDAFEIRAIAGDTLDVALRITSGTGRNPVLRIIGPDAELIKTVGGATTARVRLQCVNQTGTYTVVIHDDGFNEAYDYQITLNQSPVVPPSDGLNQYLAICDCTNRVVIRWETNAQPSGFVLEANPAVDGATLPQWMASPNWMPVVAPFEVIADHFYFTESPTNGTRFYRLRKPD